jgi:hypothetical protein
MTCCMPGNKNDTSKGFDFCPGWHPTPALGQGPHRDSILGFDPRVLPLTWPGDKLISSLANKPPVDCSAAPGLAWKDLYTAHWWNKNAIAHHA